MSTLGWIVIFLLVGDIEPNTIELTGFTDVKGNAAIKVIRFMYMDNQTKLPIQLVRGVPLFAEVEFVPQYFPSNANSLVITTMIPKSIRAAQLGGPLVIGWNQERLPDLPCALCKNTQQTYIMPVTIFVPDDNWCSQGAIPTGWKIEARARTTGQYSNSDTILAMVIDERAQITVLNSPDSVQCRGTNETINYTADMIRPETMSTEQQQ